MKPKFIKKLLLSEIKKVSQNHAIYCFKPDKDFSRKRKLPFETVIKSVMGMESKSITNELIDFFEAPENIPSTSAFVQQRVKIKPEVFKDIFDGFTKKCLKKFKQDMPILAVDGSDIQTPTNPNEKSSYFPGSNGQKPYNLLHLNALYDLNNRVYVDGVIQGSRNTNENTALQEMVDRSFIPKALVIMDRGYESYNNIAHIQEKGWYFLIRIKDGDCGIKQGLDLPDSDEFDVKISLNLSRKQSNEMKELYKKRNLYRYLPQNINFDYLPLKSRKKDPLMYYTLNFRIVRFKITEDSYETVITNLVSSQYTPEKLKKLYAARWGIETSFRNLKYTTGLLNFHSKKVTCIRQEIYAHLIMYNFTEMITSHVIIEKKQKKYTYRANFSVATHMCRLFYRGKTTSPNLETIIAKNTIPIRPGRHRDRTIINKVFRGFLYRVA